jgi:VanZ family protein
MYKKAREFIVSKICRTDFLKQYYFKKIPFKKPFHKIKMVEGILVVAMVILFYGMAQKYDLYYIFTYIDWVQHFLGGLGIGLMTTALFGKSWKWTSGIVLSIAVGWEIFERIGHLYLPLYINYGGTFDTMMDILCAILGASLIVVTTRDS